MICGVLKKHPIWESEKNPEAVSRSHGDTYRSQDVVQQYQSGTVWKRRGVLLSWPFRDGCADSAVAQNRWYPLCEETRGSPSADLEVLGNI